jgi:glycerol-3-phosphate dehydrogenase
LVTIIGGKWTTFRKMAEDVIDKLEESHGWPATGSVTSNLPLHGAIAKVDLRNPMYFYGADAALVEDLASQEPDLKEVLSTRLGIIKAQVIWAARNEMARTVEDVLARRIRALFLDAAEAVRIAPQVAHMLAGELGHNQEWEQQQLDEFRELAKTYMLN